MQKILGEKSEEKSYLGDVGIQRMVILKWILRKQKCGMCIYDVFDCLAFEVGGIVNFVIQTVYKFVLEFQKLIDTDSSKYKDISVGDTEVSKQPRQLV